MAGESERSQPQRATEGRPAATVVQKLLGEAIGTFLVTATAIGVDVFYYTHGNIDSSSRWLARGFATAAVIYALSELSGAHIDPAITIGFFLRRVFPPKMAVGYIGAQFLGAFAAAAIWLALVGPYALRFGTSHPGHAFSGIAAAGTETVLTFAVMFVILTTAEQEATVGKQAALAVGFTVAACGFAAGPISGASMNPARTIAPQLLTGEYGNIWIYAVGPVLGAALAVAAHFTVSGPPSRALRHAARGRHQT
jgi:aquaporin Z